MSKLTENGKLELIERLSLTQRRVDQLVDKGVLVQGSDNKFDIELNVRRYRAYKTNDLDYVEREIEEATHEFECGVRALEAERSVAKRRRMVERNPVGHQIGRMDNAFLLLRAMSPQAHRPLMAYAMNPIIGNMLADYFSLLRFQFAADEPVRKRARPSAA